MVNKSPLSYEKSVKKVITAHKLFKLSGVLLILFGLIYCIVQVIHPDSTLENLHSVQWKVTSLLSLVMSLFAFFGLFGLYFRQTEESGFIGFIGFIFFEFFWLISFAFAFLELFILPLIVSSSPAFVQGIMSLFDGTTVETDLGVFPFLANYSGIMYIGGGVFLGIGTLRARIFPKANGLLLTLSALVTIFAAIVPYPLSRVFALPMGITMMLFGFSQFMLTRKE
jgi:hypothetical protein